MSAYDPRLLSCDARILERAINNNNCKAAKIVLQRIATVDCALYTVHARPLYTAFSFRNLEMADILIAHSASPNYVCNGLRLYIKAFSGNEPIVKYLLQKGSWIPRSMWDNLWVAEYTGRLWNPSNHASWPDSVRAQMQTLLLITGARRGMPFRRDLLFYLFQWVLSAYWTLVDG